MTVRFPNHRHSPLLAIAFACAAAGAQPAGDAARGQRLFLQCQACHSLQGAASGTIGPTLNGVVGRKAAAIAGYVYSPALGAAGLVWDASTLDKWLEHPNALVPGTKMIFMGVPNAVDRADIIAFLGKSGGK
jgi:cytochrome c